MEHIASCRKRPEGMVIIADAMNTILFRAFKDVMNSEMLQQ